MSFGASGKLCWTSRGPARNGGVFTAGKAFLVTFQSYIRPFRPSGAPSRQKWAIWQQERTFLLPTSTSNGKAEQSHSGNVNSASFRRRQGAIPPATSGAEQGLSGHL